MTVWQEIYQKRRGLWIFIPLMLIYAASYFQRTSLPGTIFDTLSSELHLDAMQMANLASLFVYPYAVCQLISGSLIDRFCGTRVVLAGGIIFLAGAILFPLSSHISALYLSRALTGIGSSTMYLSLVRETDRLFGRKNYAVMFGIAYTCGYGGGLMGTLPFAALCGVFNWRHVLLAAATFSALIYLTLAANVRKADLPPVPKTPFSLKPFAAIITNPLSWLITFCGGTIFCIYMVIQTVFGKKFLQDFAGMSSNGAATVIFMLTLICMSTMLGVSFLTRLTQNRRRPLAIIAVGICTVSSLLMLPAIYFHWHYLAFAVLFCSFAVAAGVPPIFSMVMQEYNARSIIAQSASVSNMFGYLSVGIVSQLIGIILSRFDYTVSASGAKIYSANAYMVLFAILAAVAVVAFAVSWKLPETRGHYVKKYQE